MDAVRVSLKREEVPVVMETADGTERQMTLKEMVGKDRDAYLQSMSGRMRLSPNGQVVGVKAFDGLQAGLLAKCLYDEDGELVDVKEIQAFPTKTLQTLFEVAQRINGLDKAGEEDVGND